MNGIILINKEKGITSREVVNQISKRLNIKKVGHAGTLDPLATGLMVVGVGKGTKVLDLLTMDRKEYIATVKMGIETDTLDITGTILKSLEKITCSKEKLEEVLLSFKKEYLQTVPKYSAVKKEGKRLYEYARNNLEVELPQRMVQIFEIELLNYDYEKKEFTFKTLVSKGTYIRSLIQDIGKSLDIPCTMKDLIRTKSGKFLLNDSNLIDEEYKIIPLKEAIDFKSIVIDDNNLLNKIRNGNKIKLNCNIEFVMLLDSGNQELAIYQKDKEFYRCYKML